MTDRLRSRERTLPEGFQFGDGAKCMPLSLSEYERIYDAARVRVGDTIRVKLPRTYVREGGWNDIDRGEH